MIGSNSSAWAEMRDRLRRLEAENARLREYTGALAAAINTPRSSAWSLKQAAAALRYLEQSRG